MNSKAILRVVAALFVLAFVVGGVAQEKPASVAGKWELTRPGPQGPVTSTLTLEQDGANLKGTISGQRGDAPATGTIKGKDITFSVKRQTPNGEITVEYKGTVDGSTMKGTATGAQRNFDWTAKKL